MLYAGKRAACPCSHHRSKTSLAQHGKVGLHRPTSGKKETPDSELGFTDRQIGWCYTQYDIYVYTKVKTKAQIAYFSDQ